MADRFFTRDPIPAGDFVLTGPEAHHLHAVRRIGVGESIVLFNGDGREYPAEVLGVGKKAIQLIVGEPREMNREQPCAPWIASAIPKGDRLDFLIEKLTELGAARFTPLVTERSAVRPKADVVEKYERMVIEASKQCGRNVLMAVEPPISWTQFANRSDLPARRLILHPGVEKGVGSRFRGEVDSRPLFPHPEDTNEPSVFAIGPEGGFTDAELAVPDWAPISIGPTVLRIETAAIAACLYNF